MATRTFSKQLGELLISVSMPDDLDDYEEVYRNSHEIMTFVEKLQKTTFNEGKWVNVNTQSDQDGVRPDDRGDVRSESDGSKGDVGSNG